MATRIVIIGGGPAGYEAALVAAARGPEVAVVTVIDCDGIGGACVVDPRDSGMIQSRQHLRFATRRWARHPRSL